MARTISLFIAAGMLLIAASVMMTARPSSLFLERDAPAERTLASAASPAA
jgi:hypothetical protein